MINEDAKKYVDMAVGAELAAVRRKYGDVYHSGHEAYAVLREKFEEAEEELGDVRHYLERCWKLGVRQGDGRMRENDLRQLLACARKLALEAVQV